MAKIIFLYFILANSLLYAQTDVINNESIIKLFNAGISKEVIIKKIQISKQNTFDISTDELVKLKLNKIPDTILIVLIEKANMNNSNDKNLQNLKVEKKETILEDFDLEKLSFGFFYLDKLKPKFKQLPNCYPNQKIEDNVQSNNVISGFLDLIPLKESLLFYGEKSTLLINNDSPTFYYKKNGIISGSELDMITLVHAIVNKKRKYREIILDKKSDIVIPTKQLIKDNLIKISFEKKLPTGSYFFLIGNNLFHEFDIVK